MVVKAEVVCESICNNFWKHTSSMLDKNVELRSIFCDIQAENCGELRETTIPSILTILCLDFVVTFGLSNLIIKLVVDKYRHLFGGWVIHYHKGWLASLYGLHVQLYIMYCNAIFIRRGENRFFIFKNHIEASMLNCYL